MPHTRTLALALALAACGGGDKKNNNPPDAPMQPDSGTDSGSNATCTSLTAGMLDAAGFNPGAAVAFNGPGGDAGDGHPLTLQFEFYEPAADGSGSGSGSGSASGGALAGTFDLSQPDYQNYANCPICVIAYSTEEGGKIFFQKSGTITLTEDPTTNGHMIATISDLELQEVTIDQDYNSTPVADGQCATYGASLTFDHDKAPNAWTCDHAAYVDGTACDCVCGAPDPDCGQTPVRGQTVNGCTANQVCSADACLDVPANDLCAAATTLTLGTTVNGTTVGAYGDYSNGLEGQACTGFHQAGGDVAYMVHLTAATAYTVTLSGLGADFDASVSLLGPGAATVCDPDPITTCVAGADAGVEGQDETFTYTPTTTGDYYVIVDSFYPNESGAFTLKVE